jgi:glycosyltransferase involved in cell wall biosynthesis
MRIVQLNAYHYPFMGGIEHRIHHLSRRLAKEHEVIVLTGRMPGTVAEEMIDGYRVIRLDSWYINIYNPPFISTKGILGKLNELDPDIVDFHYRWAPSYTRDVMKYAGTVIHTAHNTFGEGEGMMGYFSRINDRRFRDKCANFSKIICVSEFICHNYAQNGYPQDKLVVVPNGVEIPTLRSEEEDFILSLGRIVRTKGLSYLMEAMREVDTPLLVCGAGPDRKHLEKLVEKYRLRDKVRFLGRVSEERKAQLFASCKMYVMPSTFEAYGIAAAEAMSYGRPVVVSNVGGLPEVVKDCGILVPPRDSQALAEGIRSLLADGQLRAELGRKAKLRAELYSWDHATEKVDAVYRQVLDSA